MESPVRNIAARVVQASVILCVVSSFAATPAVSSDVRAAGRAEASPRIQPSQEDREAWFWGDLELLTTLLCLYFGCDGGTVWMSTNQVVIDRISAQIANYEENGVDQSLTAAERASMLQSAYKTEAHVSENSGYLDPALETEYLAMLADVIEELES